jgi:SAM-dependent methyltransferase
MEEVNEGILREFQRRLPETGRALDVGCGRGELGEAVKELGWRIWGIEENREACATAVKRLDGVVCADLNDDEAVGRGLAGERPFDALIFSDVLNHVFDPRTVLERYLPRLAAGGRVFVSVPNAVVWTHRFQWLMGRVRYEDAGAMDRAHLRFFTFDTAEELIRASGCTVERVSSTPYIARAALPLLERFSKAESGPPNPRALIDSSAYKTYMKFVYPAESAVAAMWPAMLAFRIVLVGRWEPSDAAQADRKAALHAVSSAHA